MKLTKYDKQAIVRAIMMDVPKPDKTKRKDAIQAAVVKAMSPECRKLYNKTPDALIRYYVGGIIEEWSQREIIRGDVSEGIIKALIKPYIDEEDARTKAESDLHNAVQACTTLKMLETRLPEFKKYFPTVEAPTKNLPALANVVAGLSKLGWPKGVK